MATSEPGAEAKGAVFGEAFVKQLTHFVQTFMAMDKAQSSVKKVFSPKVFGKVELGRAHSFGRGTSQGFLGNQGPRTSE